MHQPNARPQYHFVIVDYLCEVVSGVAIAGSDVTDLAFATEDELSRFNLTPTATRIFKKAFAMARGAKRGGQCKSRRMNQFAQQLQSLVFRRTALENFDDPVVIRQLKLAAAAIYFSVQRIAAQSFPWW